MYRGEAEELSKQPGATKEQVAEKAKAAVELEQRIRTLYATIDAAYKQAKGQELSPEEADLYYDSFSSSVDKYKEIFHKIFVFSGNEAHYNMMMGIQE